MANIKTVSPEGRMRHVKVFQAVLNYNGDAMEKSVVLLIPKTADLSGLQQAITRVAAEEWGAKVPPGLRRLTTGQKPILKDGDEKYETQTPEKKPMYEEYRGCWVLSASCQEKQPIVILDPNRCAIVEETDIYDGCYGKVVINISAYTSKPRMGFAGEPMLSIRLVALQKTKDGDPIETSVIDAPTDDELNAFFGGGSSGKGFDLDNL